MSRLSSEDKRRRKLSKSEKSDKNDFESLLLELLEKDASRRRKRSPSLSRSPPSIDGSRGNAGNHRDKGNRRRSQGRTKTGTDSSRRQSRSTSFGERNTDANSSGKNESASSANVSKMKKVERNALLPTKPTVQTKTARIVLADIFKPVAGKKVAVKKPLKTVLKASIPNAASKLKDAKKPKAKKVTVNAEDGRKSLEVEYSDNEKILAHREYIELIGGWKGIVKHGLPNAATEQLLRTYRPGQDGQGFRAPKLNSGLRSLLNGVQIVMDELEVAKQNQLGVSIRTVQVAAHRAVNKNHGSGNFAQVIVEIDDAVRMMAQLHYSTSIARRQSIVQNLGIDGIKIENFIGDILFNPMEEMEIVEKTMNRRLSQYLNEESKLCVSSTQKDAEQLVEETKVSPSPKKESKKPNRPDSPRFAASPGSRLTVVQEKLKTKKTIESDKKLKPNKKIMPNELDASEKFPGFAEMARMARVKQGFPETTIPMVMNVLAPSTVKSYEKHMEKWWYYSRRENVDTFDPRLDDVMEYLTKLWNNGATLSILNRVRSAVSFLTRKNLAKNKDLRMFYRRFK